MSAASTYPHERWLALLRDSLAEGKFVKLTLGKPRAVAPERQRVFVRPLTLRGQECLSFVHRHATRDVTLNLAVDTGLQALREMVLGEFDHAHLITRTQDVQLVRSRKGVYTLRVGKADAAAAPVDTAHDRAKRHALSLDTPFLAELGVTDAQQRLVPAMARKWRQINKFVEVLEHAIAQSPLAQRDGAEPVRVLDFGAGKGYLTFAVHHMLRAAGRVPEVTGVELREDLTTLCNDAAATLGFAPGQCADGGALHFATGDVRSFAARPIDIMIALHACDTATDVAMHRGVTAGADIILCSPCCHQELRPQLRSPPVLAPLLRHGIHMTTQAEMLTDALRALLLQTAGYDTRVFEFISPEQTSKNRMVLAVRRSQPLPPAQLQAVRDELAALKAFFGVRQQTLETLLADTAAGG